MTRVAPQSHRQKKTHTIICYSDYLRPSKYIINIPILIKSLTGSRTLNATEYNMAVVTSNYAVISDFVTLK
jgi:hypothetical protein